MNSKMTRFAMNFLARGLRLVIARGRINGAFAVTATGAFFEDQDGIRYRYHFSEYGVGGNIDSGGNEERLTRSTLLKLLPSKATFYDIGAHEGLYSLFVMQKRQDVTTISFEPLPDHLLENIKLNGFSDSWVQPVAIGASNQTSRITTNQRSSNYIVTKPSDTSVREVSLVSLDDYVRMRQLPPPNIIKIDIEGMEPAAILGARRTLKQVKPIIVCEINHCFHRYQPDLRSFIAQMTETGYNLHKLTDEGELRPIVDVPAMTSELQYSADYNYWFMPQGWSATS